MGKMVITRTFKTDEDFDDYLIKVSNTLVIRQEAAMVSCVYGIVLFVLGCLVGVCFTALVWIGRESRLFEDMDFYRIKEVERLRSEAK